MTTKSNKNRRFFGLLFIGFGLMKGLSFIDADIVNHWTILSALVVVLILVMGIQQVWNKETKDKN
jgi:hypothetical protein